MVSGEVRLLALFLKLYIMTTYDACSIIEGFCGYEPTEQEIIDAFQFLLNTGVVWQLQGFYGRTATALIEAGLIKK